MTAKPKPDPGASFTREEGVIHIGGIDALVRLTLDQVRTAARSGLKTGMFVSGYRGSPVGMLDAAYSIFLGHEIGRELNTMSQWLDEHRDLLGLVACDLSRCAVKATGRQG